MCTPLGKLDSYFTTIGQFSAQYATGHLLAEHIDVSRFEAFPFDSPVVYGAMAGLYSTVDDVAVWMRFLAAADAAPGAGPHASATADRPPTRAGPRSSEAQTSQPQARCRAL